MRPFLPALLLALFWGWSGTFQYGASAAATGLGVLALLVATFWGGPPSLDPLGLGSRGRWLLGLLYASVVISWWLSPVSRAGWSTVVLLPAFLSIPSSVQKCWRGSDERRLGHLAVAALLLSLASWSLFATVVPDRATQPLGHHLLWVAVAVSWIPRMLAESASSWSALRWTARGAGLVAIASVLATGSLLGLAGLLAVLLGLLLSAGARQERSRRPLLLGLLAAIPLVAWGWGGRLLELVAGADSSWLARRTYWEAGISGWLRRPWMGWGPGSTAWTLGFDLRPRPGINPAGEVVGDLHSVPLQLLREVGIVGTVATLVVLWVWTRRRLGCQGGPDPRGVFAGPSSPLPSLIGLAAAGVVGLAGVTLGTSGVWIGLAVLAGGAVATSSPDPADRLLPHPVWRGYAVLAALLLAPNLWAMGEYDAAVRAAARRASKFEVDRHIERALRFDPYHPLYRARSGGFDTGSSTGRRWTERLREPPASAPFWLLAAANLDGEARSRALERARISDPFDWAASFSRLVEDPDSPQAALWGVHAVLVEPRLVASDFLRTRVDLRRSIATEVREWPGVAAGLRVALAQALTDPIPRAAGAGAELIQTWDEAVMTSPSLHLFHRSPWPTDVAAVAVDFEWAESLAIPSASVLLSTERDALGRPWP